MKKLLLILLCLPIIGFASFPIFENNTYELLSSENIQNDDDEPSIFVYVLRGSLVVSVLGFLAYFLIKYWWRAWRNKLRWVQILTYIVFGFLALLLLIGVFFSIVGVYNPGG